MQYYLALLQGQGGDGGQQGGRQEEDGRGAAGEQEERHHGLRALGEGKSAMETCYCKYVKIFYYPNAGRNIFGKYFSF